MNEDAIHNCLLEEDNVCPGSCVAHHVVGTMPSSAHPIVRAQHGNPFKKNYKIDVQSNGIHMGISCTLSSD